MRAARCFAEPWWWAALAVLFLNDHFLKGAGVLPGWVTGKLSDFAGLLVAPALLVSAFHVRARSARAICFMAVVLPFVAIKLSAASARELEGVFAFAGMPWRIWTDPTDLLALGVLIPLWRLCRPRRAEPADVRQRSPIDRAGVLLGALACVATSKAYHGVETAAFLVNSTLEPLEVRVSRLPHPVDCASLDPELGFAPRAELFAFETIFTLESAHAAPLDVPFWDPEDPDPEERVAAPCAAVLVEIRELPPTVVFWGELPAREIDTLEQSRASLDPQAVYVERAASRLFITGSEHVRTLSIAGSP